MSTLKVNTIQNTSAAHSSTPEQIAEGRTKLWASIDGTDATLNDSYNCSSVTDEGGTGDWTLNFSITMANTNYCIVGMSENYEGTNSDSYTVISEMKGTRTTTSFRFRCPRMRFDQQTFPDSAHMGIAVFGDV